MNGQDTFLWGLQINDPLTTESTVQMTVIALGVAVICFICNIAYNYLYHGVSQLLTSDENKFLDLMEIAHCFALIFCLSLCTPTAKTVAGTLEAVNEAISLSSVWAQEFAALLDRPTEEQHTTIADNEKTALGVEVVAGEDPEGAMNKELQNIDQGGKIDESAPTLKQISQTLNPVDFVAMLLHALAVLLVRAVQIIILGLGVVIVRILVILGPFVSAFPILPVFQKQLSNWSDTLCSAGTIFIMIDILNQIIWFTFKLIYDSDAFNAVDEATRQLQYLGMDLALIGSYCCCFWLASKIAGYGDTGRIIPKTVSIVTAAAAMTTAGSVIAGGATSVGAAASLDKSVINNEE